MNPLLLFKIVANKALIIKKYSTHRSILALRAALFMATLPISRRGCSPYVLFPKYQKNQ